MNRNELSVWRVPIHRTERGRQVLITIITHCDERSIPTPTPTNNTTQHHGVRIERNREKAV